MAIISSIAIGKSRKSAGNITYQHYYGKEVAKQKIEPRGNKNVTEAQLERQTKQANVSELISIISPFVTLSVSRDKGKSATATFIKHNKDMLYTAFSGYKGSLSSYTGCLSNWNRNGHTAYQNIGINSNVVVTNDALHVITVKVYPRKQAKKVEMVILAQNGYRGNMLMKTVDMDLGDGENNYELVSWDYFTATGLPVDDDSSFLFCVRIDGKPVSNSVFIGSGLGALFVP